MFFPKILYRLFQNKKAFFYNRPRLTDFSILFVCSLLITLPIYLRGIPIGPDTPHHYQFAAVFYKSLTEGVFYPGWGWIANNYYGDLGVRFYPPISAYLIALFRLVTGEWFTASVTTIFLLFLIGGIGVYKMLGEWFSRRAALIAGCLYLLLPYHTNQIYNAFLFGEFCAAAILPFCFLFATRVIRRGNLADIIGLGVAWALLFLAHLPTSVTGSISLGIYCFFCLFSWKKITHFALLKSSFVKMFSLSLGAFLALMLSAFYLVKLATELYLVRVASNEAISGDFSYTGNFVLAEFFTFSGITVPNEGWYIDLLFIMTALISLPGLIFYLLPDKSSGSEEISGSDSLRGMLIVWITSVVMSLPVSFLVWKYFPLIQKIQFPFRWMVITSLISTVFVGLTIDPLISFFADSRRRYIALLASGLMLIGFSFTLSQTIRQTSRSLSKRDIAGYIEDGSTNRSLPLWLPVGADNDFKEIIFEREQKVLAVGPDHKTIEVFSGQPPSTRVPLFYYPHWRAFSNDTPIKTSAGLNGVMEIEIDNAQSKIIEFKFIEPPAVRFAQVLSICSLFACLIVVIFRRLF